MKKDDLAAASDVQELLDLILRNGWSEKRLLEACRMFVRMEHLIRKQALATIKVRH